MISVLIVDDNSDKIKNIKSLFFEFPEIKQNDIKTASDANNARSLIEKKQYDLLILDLVIPNNFGEDPIADNGIDFLKEIKSDPNKKQPSHIIGISSFENLIDDYTKEFEKELWFLVHYQEHLEDWKEGLRSKIDYLILSKVEIESEEKFVYNFDVAIITALQSELDKVLQLPIEWSNKKLPHDSSTYYIGTINKRDNKIIRVVCSTAPQMGMCASSTLSMKLIYNFKPRYLIMSGIAAGIEGEVNLGDILVSEQCWDAASGKIKKSEENGYLFLPDPKCKTLNEDIKEILMSIKATEKYLNEIRSSYVGTPPSTALGLHIGPMASVPAVIQSKDEIKKIQNVNRKLIGLEMEAYGVFYSASHCPKPKPIPLSIKSVVDFANENKNDSYHDYASYTSACFIFHLIKNELNFDF